MKATRILITIIVGCMALFGIARLLHRAQAARLQSTASIGDVVINEVAWGGTVANSVHEWIELKNNTTATIDLTGWALFSNDGTPSVILSGTIPISGYFLLERTADSAVSDIPANQLYAGALNNTGEVLTLADALTNVIDTANGNGGGWPSGSGSPDYDSMERIDPFSPDTDSNWAGNDGITRNGLDANSNPINGTPKQQNSVYAPYAPPSDTPPGSVLISAVHFSALAGGDEGFRLTNVSTQAITLTNWIATDGQGEGTIDLTGTLQPDRSIWLTRNAISFTQQFGFKPDYEYETDSDLAVPNLVIHTLPQLNTSDELGIREGASNWIDAVVWGSSGNIADIDPISPTNLWTGSNLFAYTSTLGATGEILYRKLDEATSKIVTDTNTALDWANDRTDPISGRKVMYPGWDFEKFWQTAKVTATSHLTVAIAPDNAFRVISDYLGSAQHSIKMEVYSFDNVGLFDVLSRTLHARSISVTALLEGGPPGGVDDQELWICQQLESIGGQCWFIISDSAQNIYDRYDYMHAKMTIVDDQIVAIGSENFSPNSMPYDDFSDGTLGQRGTYFIADAPGVVTRALEIWNADFDPINHRDIYRWTMTDTTYGAPPLQFVPITITGGSAYRVQFPNPIGFTAPLSFELLTSPESSLRASDSLLGLIDQAGAGDSIDGEQLDEPPHWGNSTSNAIDDPDVRLQALIDAASRGAHVRLLLDRYFDDPASPTSNLATVNYIDSLRASSPTLMSNLEVRHGDPAFGGIHNKMFLFNIGGRKVSHVGSLNGTEGSNKVNREIALQVDSGTAYDYLRAMFEYDWAFQPRIYLPMVLNKYIPPADHLLVSKVFYLGSTGIVTGSEWVQIYNPTAITVSLGTYKIGDEETKGGGGFGVDGMWQFPVTATIAPNQKLNIAMTSMGFHDRFGFYPDFVFYGGIAGLTQMRTYITWTSVITFSLANTGDEVLLLGSTDQLIDGVAYGTGALPGNVSCPAIVPPPFNYIARTPIWVDTNNCINDFVGVDGNTIP